MSTLSLALILSLIFIFSFSACFYFIWKYDSSKLSKRLSSFTQNSSYTNTDDIDFFKFLYTRLIEPLIQYSLPKKNHDLEKIKKKFITAGYRQNSILMRFFGLKTFIALAIPIAYLIMVFIFSIGNQARISVTETALISILLCAGGYYLPDGLISYRMKSRKQELFDAFPTTVDLIRVCISAGMGLDAAITRVGKEIQVMSKAMATEFTLLATELRAGSSREAALRNFAIRTDLEEVKALVSMILQADRFGTSVTEALSIFSEDLRVKRKMAAQAQAAKVPVKMSLPLILCIFPALFVVLTAPVAFMAMGSLK